MVVEIRFDHLIQDSCPSIILCTTEQWLDILQQENDGSTKTKLIILTTTTEMP